MHKIMIIDDDPEMVQNVTAILESDELSIDSHDTVSGAIDALEEFKPDLLILDVMFPENPAGGFDIARRVRQTPELQGLPIILLTSINQSFPMDFSGEDIDEEWMPVQCMLEKPVKLAEIKRAVEDLLER
jgi:CheY-like chemotaxis protein